MTPSLLLLSLLAGCIDEPPRYLYGQDLDAPELVLWTRTVGVYPDTSILDDPNNPFLTGAYGELRWDLVSDGAWVPAFYAWGTHLAREPSGEAQFYTATALGEVYARRLAADEDLYFVRALAIAGHQVVLDEFPDSLTYDESGTIGYRLAPLAYQAILDLGGEPQGDWIVVPTEDGGSTIVPAS
jgi:hypothetical protein